MSISAVVLLGLLIFVLLRTRYMRWSNALLCTAFGFLVAKTAAAPVVQAVLDGFGGLLGQLRF